MLCCQACQTIPVLHQSEAVSYHQASLPFVSDAMAHLFQPLQTTRNKAAAALVQQLNSGQAEFEEQQKNGIVPAAEINAAMAAEVAAVPAAAGAELAEGEEIPAARRLEMALARCAPIMVSVCLRHADHSRAW